jgi:hypothetical protein
VYGFSGQEDQKKLRHVVMNKYLWEMIPLIASKTLGLIDFKALDANGDTISDPKSQYLALNSPGQGYISEWPLMLRHLTSGGDFSAPSHDTLIDYEESFFSLSLLKALNWISYTFLCGLFLFLYLLYMALKAVFTRASTRRTLDD